MERIISRQTSWLRNSPQKFSIFRNSEMIIFHVDHTKSWSKKVGKLYFKNICSEHWANLHWALRKFAHLNIFCLCCSIGSSRVTKFLSANIFATKKVKTADLSARYKNGGWPVVKLLTQWKNRKTMFHYSCTVKSEIKG